MSKSINIIRVFRVISEISKNFTYLPFISCLCFFSGRRFKVPYFFHSLLRRMLDREICFYKYIAALQLKSIDFLSVLHYTLYDINPESFSTGFRLPTSDFRLPASDFLTPHSSLPVPFSEHTQMVSSLPHNTLHLKSVINIGDESLRIIACQENIMCVNHRS